LRPPFLAEHWFEGKWQHSDQLLVWLRDGYVDLDRCSIEQAKAFKPEAFEEAQNMAVLRKKGGCDEVG
jgi:hypothetical protein